METLHLDKAALAWRLNLPLEDPSTRLNVQHGDSSERLAKRLFAKLPLKTVQSLRRYYSMDFQLFGYKAQDYFNETQRKMYQEMNENDIK